MLSKLADGQARMHDTLCPAAVHAFSCASTVHDCWAALQTRHRWSQSEPSGMTCTAAGHSVVSALQSRHWGSPSGPSGTHVQQQGTLHTPLQNSNWCFAIKVLGVRAQGNDGSTVLTLLASSAFRGSSAACEACVSNPHG